MTTLRPMSALAKRVHDDIMGLDPDAAVLYAQMVLAGALQYDIEAHHEVLQKRLDQVVAKRATRMKDAVTKTFIAKRVSGEPVDALLAAAQVISKAGFGQMSDEDRRKHAAMQYRDAGGRFGHSRLGTEQRKITYKTTVPMKDRYARAYGIPEGHENMSRDDKARFQQAYMQVSDLLGQFADAPTGSTALHLTYRTPNGDLQHVISQATPDDLANSESPALVESSRFKGRGRLVDAQVIVDGGLTAQGAAFNLVGNITNPYGGGLAARALAVDENGVSPGAQGLGSFADDWDRMLTEDVKNPSNRLFRRVSRTSQALSDTLGPNVPSQLKLALAAADAVGQYGPEAQKVIGPHADRAAYRYRGVERAPDPALRRGIDSLAAQHGGSTRQALIYGWEQNATRQRGAESYRVRHESPVISYFKSRVTELHSTDLNHLQRKSGVIPPSEGVIIDKTGKVVTQAVGYGDDWYLPFNLKTLSKLKGGDYIRTRTWGGLTTEDIYAGLMSGAKSVTVVSNNGVYTVEFDNDFTGKRRYNDKAGRMVKRYGHLLDAVKSEKVTLGDIPPGRLRELQAAAAIEGGDPRGSRADRLAYEDALRQAVRDEEESPQLGPAATRDLAEQFLNEKATEASPDGTQRTWNEMAMGYVARNVAAEQKVFEQGLGSPDMIRQMQLMGLSPQSFDEDQAKRAAAGRVSDPQSAIVALGYEREWAPKLEHAEAEYRESMSPLSLNGAGYDKAQKALREQFPYYIANVSWQPNLRGGQDTGYVKPKFNRPEGALAGYFDPNINGNAKVSADQTRHQNRGVSYITRDEVKAQRNAAREAASPASPEGAKQSDVAELNALRRLHSHIAGQTTVRFEGENHPIGPKQREQLAAIAPSTRGMSMEDLLGSQGGDLAKAKEKVLADVDAINSRGLFPINQVLVDAVKSPGQAAQGVPYTTVLALSNSNQTFDFGDEKFGPNRTPAQYKVSMDGILTRLGLDVDTKDVELDAYIQDTANMLETAQKGGVGRIRAGNAGEYENRIKSAVQVKQLRRRAEEAQRQLDAAAEMERKEREAALRQSNIGLAGPGAEEFLGNLNRTIPGEIEPKRDDES